MKPDFVQQIALVESELRMVSTSVANYWKDDVQERFYNSYMDKYRRKLELFIHGGSGLNGMGLEELLAFLDRKEREMEMLGRF